MQPKAGRALMLAALVAFAVMIAGCADKSEMTGDAKMEEIDSAFVPFYIIFLRQRD